MKVEIKNFGPIEYLEFDLDQDLHLIYGQNAIGKSYATYCLYCLMKNITNKSITANYHYPDESNPFKTFVEKRIKNIKGESSIDITKEYIQLIENELSNILLSGLQNSLLNTFSSLTNLRNRFTNKNYEIIVSLDSKEKIIITSDDEGAIQLKYSGELSKIEFVEKKTKSTRISLFVNGKIEFGKPNEDAFTSDFIIYGLNVVNKILRKLDFNIRDIYYLPASRSGLYQALNAFTPIIAELTQNRFFIQNKSIELPSLSEPLSDYFIDLSTVDKKNINKEFEEVIEMLEKNVLKGEVEYNDKTRRIMYKPSDIDLELNLSEASSMVAEISPIVIYFKHIINYKYSSNRNRDRFFFDPYYNRSYRGKKQKLKGYDVIFIEEPEAHLHPEIQIALIEVFAKLSDLNLKIFITSHSNYMFNKINNLLLDNKIDKDKIMVYHLVKNDNGSTQNKEMQVTQEGINDDNFQEVSEKLYYERMKIYEK